MATLDFTKLPSNTFTALFMSPGASGALGITNIDEPLAAELNNTGGTSGMYNISDATSWNDFEFGTQASETTSQPALSEATTAEEFGISNFGGTASHYYPLEYDDNSNLHSIVYDMVKTPGTALDAALRIDGDIDSNDAAADGQFVSTYRVQSEAETNPFTPGESKRYTKGYIPRGEFSHFTPVGDHAITTIPATTATPEPGAKGRFRALQQSRDVTNRLRWSTSNPDVIQVYPGGAYEVTGADEATATITVTDDGTGDTKTIAITVTDPA